MSRDGPPTKSVCLPAGTIIMDRYTRFTLIEERVRPSQRLSRDPVGQ